MDTYVYTKCAKCWETKCDHWIVEVEKKMMPARLFWSAREEIVITLRCSECKNVAYFYEKNVHHRCKDKCSNGITISENPISDDDMLKKCDKYPRIKCIHCKGSGSIPIPSYIECPNCDGTGGLMCLHCIKGSRLVSTISGRGFPYFDHCNCKFGYAEVCTYCGGHKTIRSETKFSNPCKNCDNT